MCKSRGNVLPRDFLDLAGFDVTILNFPQSNHPKSAALPECFSLLNFAFHFSLL